jgi:hypothetical protein
MRTAYTPPPEPVYKAGKRKEKCSKALKYIVELMTDSKDENLVAAYWELKKYQRRLTEF